MIDCCIVGSGISGLSAAHYLSQHNRSIRIIDKGFLPGGRTATRPFEIDDDVYTADYGAQYFTTRTPEGIQWAQNLEAERIIRKWSTGFHVLNQGFKEDATVRWIGNDGMRSISIFMAKHLSIEQRTKVTRLSTYPDGWTIALNTSEKFKARSILFTSPLPQTLDLLSSSLANPPQELHHLVQEVVYEPCFAIVVGLKSPSNIPSPGGIWMNGTPIAWIADNQKKGISTSPCLTIHLTPQATETWFDEAQDAIWSQLTPYLSPFFDPNEVVFTHFHRWRYSKPTTLSDLLFGEEIDLGCFYAGDSFSRGAIEGAYLSGRAVGERIHSYLEMK